MSIVEFIEARLAERERIAGLVDRSSLGVVRKDIGYDGGERLREVQVLRAVLAEHEHQYLGPDHRHPAKPVGYLPCRTPWCSLYDSYCLRCADIDNDGGLEPECYGIRKTLRLVASIWSNHADHQDAWSPID